LLLLFHTVHTIWLARNNIRFSSAKVSLHCSMAIISSLVTLSGAQSNGKCIVSDVAVLDNFLISPSYKRFSEIITVTWKPPTITWVKANTDGSVLDFNASCSGIFRDFRGTYLGGFASNLGLGIVYDAERTGVMLAMEYATTHNLSRLCAVNAFRNHAHIPLRLRNRWHNCMQLGFTVICSHI